MLQSITMKSTTVRDLRYHFARVEHLLREGEEVEVLKRRKVIARLIPVRPTLAVLQHRPNFLARLKKLYGDRPLKVTGAQRLAEERDRY